MSLVMVPSRESLLINPFSYPTRGGVSYKINYDTGVAYNASSTDIFIVCLISATLEAAERRRSFYLRAITEKKTSPVGPVKGGTSES